MLKDQALGINSDNAIDRGIHHGAEAAFIGFCLRTGFAVFQQ